MKNIKKLIAILLSVLFVVLGFSACDTYTYQQVTTTPNVEGTMRVHFFDVGQGDSMFIELPNGETILIDAGETDQGENVVAKIQNLGYSEITYVVATHPHSDHIGGLADVYEAFEIGTTYMPNATHTTSTYDKLLTAIENENCQVIQAKQGVVMLDGDVYASFVAPVQDYYDELNNYSACLKLVFGSKSFLFMGDSEDLVEYEITDDIDVDVVKVSHHGSAKSSCYNFVSRTSAEYAVFEVGADNSYGHPHDEVVDIWTQANAKILRTDIHGDIVFITDGTSLTYETSITDINTSNQTSSTQTTQQQVIVQEESDEADFKWVLNTKSKKIHSPSCSSASTMKEDNKAYSSDSISSLISQGYETCGSCKPSD